MVWDLIFSLKFLTSVLILLLVLLFYRCWELNYGPESTRGPFRFPLVGSYFALNKRESIGRQLSRWSKLYGDPFVFQFGSVPIVVGNSWDIIQEANKSDHFTHKFKTETGKILSSSGNGISFHSGSIWHKMRKIGITIVRRYSESSSVSDNVEWAVNQSIPLFPPDDQYFDPVNILSNIMTNLAFSNIIGKSEDTIGNKRYSDLQDCAIQTRIFFSTSIWIDYFDWLRPFFRKSAAHFEKEIYLRFISILRDCLNDHRSTYVEDQTRDFTDALIKFQQDPENSELIDDGSMCQMLFEFFQASSDSTALGLVAIVRFLAQFPGVQKKVCEEIEKEIGSHRLPVPTDKTKCPYTLAVIYESLRISIPFTSGFTRSATQDSKLGDLNIKKGSAVILNYVGVTTDDSNWPEFDTFRPSRFLNDDGAFVSSVPQTYLPFGTGRRSCFGEKIAFSHLFLATVLLLRQFEFRAHGSDRIEGLEGKVDFDTQPFFLVNFPQLFKITLKRKF